MRKLSTPIWFAAFALFSASQHSLAETTDVSGRWIGRTTCPLGTVVFSIDVKGTTGTFSHGGYGPNKVHPLSFPVTIRKQAGREGISNPQIRTIVAVLTILMVCWPQMDDNSPCVLESGLVTVEDSA